MMIMWMRLQISLHVFRSSLYSVYIFHSRKTSVVVPAEDWNWKVWTFILYCWSVGLIVLLVRLYLATCQIQYVFSISQWDDHSVDKSVNVSEAFWPFQLGISSLGEMFSKTVYINLQRVYFLWIKMWLNVSAIYIRRVFCSTCCAGFTTGARLSIQFIVSNHTSNLAVFADGMSLGKIRQRHRMA